MTPIPNIPSILDDELFSSWYSRLASANGFESSNAFTNAFLYEMNLGKGAYGDTECDLLYRADILEIALNGSLSLPMIISNMTVFPVAWPFLSLAEQDKHTCNIFYGNRTFLSKNIRTIRSKAVYCPICDSFSLKKTGVSYLHRLHHIPGVRVCPIHGCPLVRCNDDAPLLTNPSSTDQILSDFIQSLSASPLKLNLTATRKAIQSRIGELYGKNLDRLSDDFCCGGFDALISSNSFDVLHFIRVTLDQKNYVSLDKMLALSSFLFADANDFVQSATLHLDPAPHALSSEYQLISDGCGDIIKLQHTCCGTRFYSTVHAINSGLQCPCCDSRLSPNIQFNKILSLAGNNEYESVTSFTSMSDNVIVRHKKCGSAFSWSPRTFIWDGYRCQCGRYNSFETVDKLVREKGSYRLVSFSGNTDDPISIHSDTCGHTFTARLRKFLASPFCRECKRNKQSQEGFQLLLEETYGNEFELVSPYINKSTKVSIKHTVCGHVFDRYPKHFVNSTFITCRHCGKTVNSNSCSDPHASTAYGQLFQQITKDFPKGKPIPLHDILFDDMDYRDIKSLMASIVKHELLKRVGFGIYAYPDDEFSDEQLAEHLYIQRNGNATGYWYGESFLYKTGYLTNKPERLQIATNVEPEHQHHGRNTHIGNCELKLRRARTEVTEDNQHVLPILDILSAFRHYLIGSTDDLYQHLHLYMSENGVSFEMLLRDMPYYPNIKSSTLASFRKAVHENDHR